MGDAQPRSCRGGVVDGVVVIAEEEEDRGFARDVSREVLAPHVVTGVARECKVAMANGHFSVLIDTITAF